MPTGATGQLGLALPVQGELSGTWGDTVNNGITQYANIAIAATLTLTNDGAVTLANTTGDASASNITSSLTGAGTVTAQFAIVKVTGTLTTTKVVTFGSGGSAPYSKTYLVVNAATGGSVSFTAFGGTGVTIAVGESAYVYYDGTNIVKATSTVVAGNVSSFTAGTTGFTPSTATTGAVTLAGTLATTNGGTNLTSFTSGGAVYATSTSALTTGTLPTASGGTNLTSFTSGGAVYATSTSALTTGTLPTTAGGTNLTSFNSGGAVYATSTSALTTGTLPLASGGTAAVSAPAAMASLMGFTTTATAAGTTTLTNTSSYYQQFTGTTTQTVRLPVTSTLVTGWTFHIVNNSTGNVSVQSSGANAVITVLPGTTAMCTCIGTALTTAADWESGLTDFSTATGTGSVVLSTSPTLVTPVLGTPSSGTLSGCTVDGTNKVGYLNIPQTGAAKTASYTLVVGDVGKFVVLGTSGSVVIPASVFAVGDAISVFNNTTAAITCTSSAITAYIGGTNTVKTSFSLATRGVCTILFVTTTVVVITGNVS